MPVGALLPVRDNGQAYEATYRAVRAASGSRSVYHSRYQLFVFKAEEDHDAAVRWATAVAEGFGDEHHFTRVNWREPKPRLMKAIRKAFSVEASPIADCSEVRGPRPFHRDSPPVRRLPTQMAATPSEPSEADSINEELEIEMEIERELGGPPPPDL